LRFHPRLRDGPQQVTVAIDGREGPAALDYSEIIFTEREVAAELRGDRIS